MPIQMSACPNCGSKTFTRAQGFYRLDRVKKLPTGEPEFVTGEGVPAVAVVCNGCSYIHLFHASQSNEWESAPADS